MQAHLVEPSVEDRWAITQVVWVWFQCMVSRLRAARIPGWIWVVVIWAVLAFPAVSLRAAHYEEGTVIALARGAAEDGHWITPSLYGQRFVERPVLLSWIAGASGLATGEVSLWSARIPHLLFLLAGGLMVYNLVLSHTRRAPALVGAVSWFVSPMIAQKFVTAEPDVTLSVLMFGGFFVWWRGEATGRVSIRRWLAVGCLLAAAGLTKGPQPLAYFALGVGGYLLIKARWRDLPGFVLANMIAGLVALAWYLVVRQPGDLEGWMGHSRLADHFSAAEWLRDHADFTISVMVEWLPGSILLIPATIAVVRNQLPRDHDLLLAAILYAALATLVLFAWPGGVATRYAMPANLGLAVIVGVLFDRWWISRSWLIGASNTILIVIFTGLVILDWVIMPLAPAKFEQAMISARTIEGARSLVPGTVYVTDAMTNLNVLVHVARPVQRRTVAELGALRSTSLAILGSADIAALTEGQAPVRIIRHGRLPASHSMTADVFVAEIVPVANKIAPPPK